MPRARNTTKYRPNEDCANAWTDCTTPLRVRKVPKMHRKKVQETSTIFHTFIIPFFSCIITECRNAVAVIQGSSEALCTGSQHRASPSGAEEDPCRLKHPGDQGPAARGVNPGIARLLGDQRPDREGKRNRETHIAEIQHRRRL